jgi:hypothetical protein
MDRFAGITSNTVPWEILRAGGYSPRLVDAEPGPTPFADRFMEDVFERRIRVIFDRLCAGAWNHLEMVVISRTSEPEHKLYLYLREVSRLRYSESIPRLYLYNLLHTRSSESYDYGLERTRQMVRDFDASEDNLWVAIAESNRARAAVREILQLREEGRMEGSAALGMIGEFYTRNREQFADTIRAQAQNTPPAHPGSRPRILIKGAPLDHTALHRLVEQQGGYVTAEDDWRGSRAAGDLDIRMEGDPVVGVFEKYFYDTVSPRVRPLDEANAWFRRKIEGSQADGVLFYVPLEDDVVGWDYPQHLAFLQSRDVPSLLVRESAAPEPSAGLIAQVAAFVEKLRRR